MQITRGAWNLLSSSRLPPPYFGSRYGLMTAIVEAIEEDQKQFMESLDGESGDVLATMWQRLSDPQLWPAERLFFECYARAAQGEEPFDRLLPGSVDDRVDRTVALDATPDGARAQARVGLAVFRGLLLDLVGTGDREGVDAAFAAYLALAAKAAGTYRSTRADEDIRVDAQPQRTLPE